MVGGKHSCAGDTNAMRTGAERVDMSGIKAFVHQVQLWRMVVGSVLHDCVLSHRTCFSLCAMLELVDIMFYAANRRKKQLQPPACPWTTRS